MRPLLTVKQTAELLGLSVHTLYKWHETGKLRGMKVGGFALRYDPERIEKFLQKAA